VCVVTINKHHSPASLFKVKYYTEYLTSEKSNNAPNPKHTICALCINCFAFSFQSVDQRYTRIWHFYEVRQIKTHNSEFIYLQGEHKLSFTMSQICCEAISQETTLEHLTSFLSALQLRVSFGLLNNLPPFFSIQRLIVWFLNNLVFMV
jgi:hypothetical protein